MDMVNITDGDVMQITIESMIQSIKKAADILSGVCTSCTDVTGFGLIGPRKVFLLPGNPVSCLSAYDCFVGLALRRLGGLSEEWPYRKTKLPLRSKIASQIGRIEYVRLQIQEGKAEPIASGGASILSSTTRADGFLLTQESSEGFAEGEEVELWLYD